MSESDYQWVSEWMRKKISKRKSEWVSRSVSA